MKRSLLQVTKKGLVAAIMLLAIATVSQAQTGNKPKTGTAKKKETVHKKKKRHVIQYTPGSNDPKKLKEIQAQKDKEKDAAEKK